MHTVESVENRLRAILETYSDSPIMLASRVEELHNELTQRHRYSSKYKPMYKTLPYWHAKESKES
jgi:hypothetical protein